MIARDDGDVRRRSSCCDDRIALDEGVFDTPLHLRSTMTTLSIDRGQFTNRTISLKGGANWMTLPDLLYLQFYSVAPFLEHAHIKPGCQNTANAIHQQV